VDEDVDDAERRGMKDADGAESVDDAGGVAGVSDIGKDAGRDDSAVTGKGKDRVFFHADVTEPWLLWMPSRLSQLAVVALMMMMVMMTTTIMLLATRFALTRNPQNNGPPRRIVARAP